MQTYLRVERTLVLVILSRVTLVAAVVSNVDKAQWAFGRLSEEGAWSTWMIAAALEGALAITSYALSESVARQEQSGRLWVFTVFFAAISAGANVAYFYQHLPANMELPHQVMAWSFGLAAPAVALANGALAGVVTGQQLAEGDQKDKRQFQLRMAELEVEGKRQERLAANAEARKAKVEAQAAIPETSTKPPVSDGNGYQDWQAFLEDYPNMLEMTGRQIASITGTSERTGNNWKAYAREALNNG